MKLKIDEFENYAKRNGVTPSKMLEKLGGGKYAYKHLKNGCALGYDLAREMYNELGEWAFLSLVDMEEGTVDDFKAKFIRIGNKLY